MNNHILGIYRKFPITFVRGKGARLFDDKGRNYLDFMSGIATVNLGHCNNYINEKLKEQCDDLWHCYNFFSNIQQNKLAKRLVDLTFADSVFFCSTGGEAIDASLKFMRRYHSEQGNKDKNKIISFDYSFHGRTFAGISVGSSDAHKKGYYPLLPGIKRIPVGDIKAFEREIDENTAGVLIEPLQCNGGIRAINSEYLQEIRRITEENDVLLAFDEVQCGYGRTGSLFYHEQLGVRPDILSCAKAMGNGFPVAGCLVVDKVAAAVEPDCHGSTFGGNPLAMSVANAVLDLMLADGFFDSVKELGNLIQQALLALKDQYSSIISDVRGVGGIWGVELFDNNIGVDLVNDLINEGLIVSLVHNNSVIRLTPPLVIGQNEVNEMHDIFVKSLKKFC